MPTLKVAVPSSYFYEVIKVTQFYRKEKPNLIAQLARFSQKFDHFSLLNSNDYKDKYGRYELLGAFGCERSLTEISFEGLKAFYKAKPSWLFGHMGYDIKNQLEKLESRHPKKFEFDDLSFFEPLYLFTQKRDTELVEVFKQEMADEDLLQKFFRSNEVLKSNQSKNVFQFNARQTKEEYISAINKLKSEIQYGNIYEINYCQEFYAEKVELNPAEAYLQLNEKSPMPFSAFYSVNNDYLICASPERYLCKRESAIYSQPIKGTAKRGSTEPEDEAIIRRLKNDLKEQTENVMIVDLVRNDLSRTAERGSVKVEELFGVYTFPQVHQLISTVKSEVSPQSHFTDVIKNSFPMGSMTGAPKISAMKHSDKHERSRRELYSGSIGYIQPNGDCDFNVVIRSLLYSSKSNYLSLTVGGAITNMSDAQKEYEECLLKAKAIFELYKS